MGFLTPQAQGEKDVLDTFILQQLAQLRTTVVGLDDEQAHSTPSASSLNLTGLLQHCVGVGIGWTTFAVAGMDSEPEFPQGFSQRSMEETSGDSRSLDDVLAEYDRGVAIITENLGKLTDLAAPVPVPEAPWFPKDLKSWETRWVLTHLVAEIGRHVGHADIIRESIDGAGSYELNNRAEAQAR